MDVAVLTSDSEGLSNVILEAMAASLIHEHRNELAAVIVEPFQRLLPPKPGFLQERLYAGVAAGTAAVGFQDITSGSNGAYSAGPGWDACTGLGSPDGPALVTLFSGAASATGTTAGTTGGEGASAGTGSSAG